MSKLSDIPGSISPLLWLAPLPFALAMCLPLGLSHNTKEPAGFHRVAVVSQMALSPVAAASAVEATWP